MLEINLFSMTIIAFSSNNLLVLSNNMQNSKRRADSALRAAHQAGELHPKKGMCNTKLVMADSVTFISAA